MRPCIIELLISSGENELAVIRALDIKSSVASHYDWIDKIQWIDQVQDIEVNYIGYLINKTDQDADESNAEFRKRMRTAKKFKEQLTSM